MFFIIFNHMQTAIAVQQLRSKTRGVLSCVRSLSFARMSAASVKLRWNYTPDEIGKETGELIARSRSLYDQIGRLKPDELVYDNVVKALRDGQTTYYTKKNQLTYLQHVAPNKELRDASVQSDKKLSELEVELSLREDIFLNLVAANTKFGDTLKPEAKRFLERMIKIGQRNGLEHPKQVQDEIKALEHRIRNLEIDFSKNLNEENASLFFSAEELIGLPNDFLDGLKKREDGKMELTLKYPHYYPCMMYAKNPNTRKLLETAFNSRCMAENTPMLEELVKLRHKKATLLDFPNHAAFILDMRMAKNPEKVSGFLSSLEEKLQVLKDQELKLLLEYKKNECAEMKIDFDGQINSWDFRYYMARNEERKYSVDQNKLKDYFPLDQVTKGLLRIYQELLGLNFELVEDAKAWHEDVEMYSVKDSETGKLLGYFYLDLFPREGKYGHACCIPLQPGCIMENGERQVHVAAMLTNFTKPSQSRPSLLLHSEVETFFHEFGHVMHHICSETEFAFFCGTKVERDFVEAPSQMLENWVWCRDSLMLMSGHHEDHSPIPEDLLNSLINSKNANAGLFNCRQILLATFDQTIHRGDEVDIKELFGKLSESILGVKSTPGTYMPASFGHLAGGYDAQYYGYLWSEVYSEDMFQTKFAKNVLDGKVGREYRRCILKPGGSLDAVEMLHNFLGREPSQEPFLRSKGLVA